MDKPKFIVYECDDLKLVVQHPLYIKDNNNENLIWSRDMWPVIQKAITYHELVTGHKVRRRRPKTDEEDPRNSIPSLLNIYKKLEKGKFKSELKNLINDLEKNYYALE